MHRCRRCTGAGDEEIALAVNLVELVILDPIPKLTRVPAGHDETRREDYGADVENPPVLAPSGAQAVPTCR